ncbi:MAG: NAD(P)/FAD-dependent oxidoreductase [Bryobacteraceae bacterium]
MDVAVIGGGPAGLAVAVAAARRGMRVAVIESSQPPIDKACGEGLMPDSQDAARRIGIEFPAGMGRPFRGVRFHDDGVEAESPFPQGAGIGVRRTVLHQHMVDVAAAAGVELVFGAVCTGIEGKTVRLATGALQARWIVGADGSQSRVRNWAGLGAVRSERARYGYRKHFRVTPWSDFIEIHWGDGRQVYVTPVSEEEICVVAMSCDSQLRLSEVLSRFPALAARLPESAAISSERGSVAGSRVVQRVTSGNVALAGDASGSVDAITGEGLCLAFRQADALAAAMERGCLDSYESAHRAAMRQPLRMGELMLTLDRWPGLRRRVIPALAARPELFQNLLALHVSEVSVARIATTAASLCWGVISQ